MEFVGLESNAFVTVVSAYIMDDTVTPLRAISVRTLRTLSSITPDGHIYMAWRQMIALFWMEDHVLARLHKGFVDAHLGSHVSSIQLTSYIQVHHVTSMSYGITPREVFNARFVFLSEYFIMSSHHPVTFIPLFRERT